MADEHGVVRRIVWKQVCPWLIIFRIFRISISLPVLALATLGVLLMPLGWWVAEAAFLTDIDANQPTFGRWVDDNSSWPATLDSLPASQPLARFPSATENQFEATRWSGLSASQVVAVYRELTGPFAGLLDRRLSVTQSAYLLFGGLWNIIVWAFCGGVITRLAAVQLGCEERLGVGTAVKHVGRNYIWYLISPLFPLLGLVLVSLPVMAVGLLMRLDAGAMVAGLLWPLVLVGGLIMLIFMVGVGFGWPLMFPTISSESGSDAFEAFSRSFSYTFQRPLQYLFYGLVTILFGVLCRWVVALAAGQVVELSLWAASWGGGAARINEVLAGTGGASLADNGGWLIRSCNGITDVVVVAFGFAFFWCGATAIYLLLRRDADQVDLDEVFLDQDAARYGLPPLQAAAPADGGAKADGGASKADGSGEAAVDETTGDAR